MTKKSFIKNRILCLAAVFFLVIAMALPVFPSAAVYAEEDTASSEEDPTYSEDEVFGQDEEEETVIEDPLADDGTVYEGEGAESEESEEKEEEEEDSASKEDDADAEEEEAQKAAVPDYEAFGENEGFAIVPVCAGRNSVTLATDTGRVTCSKTNRCKNQAWKIRKHDDYYYFESKEQTLEEVIGMILDTETEKALELKKADMPAPQKLVAIIACFKPDVSESSMVDALNKPENLLMHERFNEKLMESKYGYISNY